MIPFDKEAVILGMCNGHLIYKHLQLEYNFRDSGNTLDNLDNNLPSSSDGSSSGYGSQSIVCEQGYTDGEWMKFCCS